MARSSRIAGGCNAPTDGKVPSWHSSVNTAIARSTSSIAVMWTATASPEVSPHRPSSVAWPAASLPATAFHSSVVTRKRGQGRWPPTPSRCAMMSLNAAIALSQQPGDVLEPGNERRGQVDSHGKHQSKVREQRQVGRLGLGEASARLAERDGVEPQEQAGEANQQAEHQNDGEGGRAHEGRTHYEKFAHENTQRRQSGDRDDAKDEAPAEHGVGDGEAAHIGDPLRALDLRNVAYGKKDRRLGQRVHRHVQEPGE